MTVFSDLVDDVIAITNRPDRLDLIKLGIRSATLKAHHSDFFPKDLFETGIQWSIPAFIQSLEYRVVIPRWRALKYLRKFDNSTSPGTPGDFFELLTPEQILDDYGVQRDNICYIAGEMLEIRSSTQDEFQLLGCYRNPDVVEDTYTSWIALDYPDAIRFGAASIVFKQTGYDEQVNQMDAMVRDEYALLKAEITGGGY